MPRLCERPGCGEAASVSYGFDSDRSTVWLEALRPDGPGAGALCRRHADAMVLPKGWWLQDRRSDAALFTAPEPAPPAAVYRPKRPRRRPAAASPLPLDPAPGAPADTATASTQSEGPGGPTADTAVAAVTAVTEPVASWVPAFDAGDDLDGLLAAKTPLLARAFRQDTRPATPER